jgi:hypothetical protein
MARNAGSEARNHAVAEQDSMFETEHWLAWLFALIAIVLGVIGIIRGFGYIGGAASTDAAAGTTAGYFGTIWDAAVWMLPAIAAGLLSMALHQTDHHRMRDPDRLEDREEGLWKTEHGLAWLFALLTIVFSVLGMLVGFHLLGGGNHQPDSLPWLLASIGSGVLTNTLHAVRHHQLASDADYIVRVVEERVGRPGIAGRPETIREPRV